MKKIFPKIYVIFFPLFLNQNVYGFDEISETAKITENCYFEQHSFFSIKKPYESKACYLEIQQNGSITQITSLSNLIQFISSKYTENIKNELNLDIVDDKTFSEILLKNSITKTNNTYLLIKNECSK
ncbi:hypothetical protein QEJ31_11715 [Pigmentibacter sp. JX0631]|uniref:hypothetical protein n=1 Tax=Pigmentibacter sp. JX0631 TaxID=2976982 RepID=UPI002469A334|nr:hypothetical protein [Pigmentibacter sp. JX0631]WGL59188.1 hypothetical protein QEJ31_11715 [Pigmentibacter sp. JX0631]